MRSCTDKCFGKSHCVRTQVFDSYRKLRGTLRFLLGNVHDFDHTSNAVPGANLPLMDRYMLHRFRQLSLDVNAAYGAYNFGAIYRAVNVFLSVDLSSFYFELGKDRLYIRGDDSLQRRACQTVLHTMLQGLLAAMAPVTPHMCEDAWQNLPHWQGKAQSLFQAGMPQLDVAWELSESDLQTASLAIRVKDVAMQALERARGAKDIGSGLDARVALHVEDEDARARLATMNNADNGVDNLKWLFVVSEVDLVNHKEDGHHTASETVSGCGMVTATVTKAPGLRCERCWNYSMRVGDAPAHPTLCERCVPVVEEQGFELPQKEAEPEPQPAAAA